MRTYKYRMGEMLHFIIEMEGDYISKIYFVTSFAMNNEDLRTKRKIFFIISCGFNF